MTTPPNYREHNPFTLTPSVPGAGNSITIGNLWVASRG